MIIYDDDGIGHDVVSISVIDKIRERIELEKLGYPPSAGYYMAIMKCLQIIDKYRAESTGRFVPQPCEDVISRQAVLDILRFEDKWLLDAKGHNTDTEIAFSGMKSRIADLPSVNPQPKTGHWMPCYGNVKCSVCGNVKDSRDVGKATHYCDFCGARMVEPQESEKI